MRQIAVLRTVQVGPPRRRLAGSKEENGRTREMSFVRAPRRWQRLISVAHPEGNAQADSNNHGTPGQAVLLYAASHYPLWQEEMGRPEIGPGDSRELHGRRVD